MEFGEGECSGGNFGFEGKGLGRVEVKVVLGEEGVGGGSSGGDERDDRGEVLVTVLVLGFLLAFPATTGHDWSPEA